MNNLTITLDLSRGVEVFRGKTLIERFEGANALEAARRCAAEKPGRYIRYWTMKEER